MKKILSYILGACVCLSAATLCACNKEEDDDNSYSPIYGYQGHYFSSFPKYKSSGYSSIVSSGNIMGADVTFSLLDEGMFKSTEVYNNASILWNSVQSFLIDVDESISTTYEKSYIYAFNEAQAGERVEVNKVTYDVFSLAKKMYESTEGYYNPAVYYSVDLYGFAHVNSSYPLEGGLPTQKYIDAFKQLSTHFPDITIEEDDGTYYMTKPTDAYVVIDNKTYNLKIDLGGIGKGYCVDIINTMMDDAGFVYGYINFGDSSYGVKKYYKEGSESHDYTVTATDPRGFYTKYCSFKSQDIMFATSGDYEQYYEIDGVRYCHIIDPTTGSPIQTGIATVTVIGGSAAEDDTLSTALSAMGKDKAVEYINTKLSDKKIIMLVFENGAGKIITNIEDLTIINTNYTLANTIEDGKIILN